VILRGKTRTIGSTPRPQVPSGTVAERPQAAAIGTPRSALAERAMSRAAPGAGQRVAVGTPRLPTGAAAPEVPREERKGNDFPGRILALEDFVAEAVDLQATPRELAQAFADLNRVLEEFSAELGFVSLDLPEGAEPTPTRIVALEGFRDEVREALLDFAGRLGQLEAQMQIVLGNTPPGPAPTDPAPGEHERRAFGSTEG
jgi:hypothetical protein